MLEAVHTSVTDPILILCVTIMRTDPLIQAVDDGQIGACLMENIDLANI